MSLHLETWPFRWENKQADHYHVTPATEHISEEIILLLIWLKTGYHVLLDISDMSVANIYSQIRR